MDWTSIIVAVIGAILGGGGLWGVIEIRERRKKSPYDMLMEMMQEQKRFYQERNAEYEREKLDSAEKSSVIMQSHFCEHKYTDRNIVCPVDKANDERLKNRCQRCDYSIPGDPLVTDDTLPRPPRPGRRGIDDDFDE